MLGLPRSKTGGRWGNAHDGGGEPELDIVDSQYREERPMWNTVPT